MRGLAPVPVMVIASSLGVAGPACARAFPQAEPGVERVSAYPLGTPTAAQLAQRRELTLAEAIVIAEKRHPGRVVRAHTIQLSNGALHEIRVIGHDGIVHTVRVDARTGTVQEIPTGP